MRLTVGGRLVVAWLVLLLGLAGCSASGGLGDTTTTTTTTAGAQDVAAIWHELVQCARNNGMPNLPDPQIDSNGEPHFPGGEPPDPPDSVRRACQPIFDRLPESVRSGGDEANPANVPALLEFAKCLRSHGLPTFPDPKSDGTFPVAGLPSKADPGFRTAMKACDRLNPDPNGRIHGSN
jgi:hypothetical protein